MVFSSYLFLFCFLPIVLAGYYLLAHTPNRFFQKVFLLCASLFFYGYYNIRYLFLLLSSILANYVIAFLVQHSPDSAKVRRKLLLGIGILFNVGLIGYYKYFDFFLTAVNDIAGTELALRNILLPLGISFFTFQQLSFQISVYKKETKTANPLDYSLFVSFFPQLVAGPIVLYEEMIPQFSGRQSCRFSADHFVEGLYFLSIGLFKKAVIADTLALLVDNGFGANGMGLLGGWVTSLSYTFQIYFDFSGYSDMAIGLGRLFNIQLPDNFDTPYLSESISTFWRKWHMTLGRALSTYVYIPLGGNRKTVSRTCVNLFLTFLVSGLWHGANWTFIIWGAAHGVLVVFERLTQNTLCRIPRTIRVVSTFLTTNFLWVLFRADSFENARSIYHAMFNFRNPGFADLTMLAQDGIVSFPAAFNCMWIVLLLFGLSALVFHGKEKIRISRGHSLARAHLLTAVICFVVSTLCIGRESVFIYYNF